MLSCLYVYVLVPILAEKNAHTAVDGAMVIFTIDGWIAVLCIEDDQNG